MPDKHTFLLFLDWNVYLFDWILLYDQRGQQISEYLVFREGDICSQIFDTVCIICLWHCRVLHFYSIYHQKLNKTRSWDIFCHPKCHPNCFPHSQRNIFQRSSLNSSKVNLSNYLQLFISNKTIIIPEKSKKTVQAQELS